LTPALRLRQKLKAWLNDAQQQKIRQFLALRFRSPQHVVYKLAIGRSLRDLAIVYGTNKWGDHWYAKHYETHFEALRRRQLNVLEIGIGGDTTPESGGGSLRMWRTYFPNSRIYGIDIHDKSPHNERRIQTFRGSQADETLLLDVVRRIGRIDIVIDDGSHRNEHVLKTFAFLFPRLSDTGMYVVEDTQTSYWPEMGGSSRDLERRDTSMGFFKNLVDGLNHVEFDRDDYEPNYYDKHIVAMHFYHGLVFIQKGMNNEGSSVRHRWLGG